ncbi:hypothetical protein ZWY2020_006876 [Hordeum vulgare]|nr:hypothetical protein ZWY2020_006876 [Hordeum vulgare]
MEHYTRCARDALRDGSFWHRRVYDRLRLHLPKQFGHRRQLAEHLEISPTKLDIEQELGGGRSAAPGSRASRSCAEPWPAPRGSSRRSSSRPPRAGRPGQACSGDVVIEIRGSERRSGDQGARRKSLCPAKRNILPPNIPTRKLLSRNLTTYISIF